MARARKSAKKGTVKVNFKDIETRTRVGKEGDYPLRCIEAVSGTSGKGNDQIEFTFEVTKGQYKGAKAWFYCTLDEASLWKLYGLLTAMGVEVPDDEMDIDLSELVDQEVVGVFTPDTYNGKRSFKMTDFCSMDDYDGDDDEDEDDEDDKKSKSKKSKKGADDKKSKKSKSKKDDDDEDEDEDEDEDDEPKKGKKSKASKKPAKGKKSKSDDDDEDEDDEDEDEPKSKKGKGKDSKKKSKKKTYDRDDVEDMDEDELQELIDEHDLDVDLDDFKKLPKKVAAVIEALEEEDLLDD